MSLRALLLAFCLVAGPALAIDPLPFNDAAEEERFRALTSELRCMMCQNQSLADSPSNIAGDLRREIFDLMRQGRSDAEIKTFLTERYGEFVLYRPPLGPTTWLLWFGPLLILIAGGVAVTLILRRRAAALAQANDSRAPANDASEDW